MTAIRDFAYMESLQQVEDEQAQGYRHRMTHAFFDIAELPGGPLDTNYRCLNRPASPPEDPLRAFLKKVLPRGMTYTNEEAYQRGNAYHMDLAPISISPIVDGLARFLVALVGGIALIAPMLVMLLPGVDRTRSIITTGVAVFLFALGVSVVVRAGNTEALIATTTYAAVLVVFVGLNG